MHLSDSLLMSQDRLKNQVAHAALQYIQQDTVIGVGSGSTIHFFIQQLPSVKQKIKGAVASSNETEALLKEQHIPVVDLNAVHVSLYVDSADECTKEGYLIKGGGGALTREKILAASADQFICIVDDSKLKRVLGKFPLPIEVIPMARGLVARQIIKMGGMPEYRQHVVTDNGNIILDVHNLDLTNPVKTETDLNNIPGVVCNGIFAEHRADLLLVADNAGIKTLQTH